MISVIMLTHNRKEYMGNMINGILRQTYADFEFIIVDNGSVDGTDKILEEYKEKDDRIKCFHIPEGSVGHGRNFGMSVSQGEYVTFVDDDDRVSEDFLMFLHLLIKQEKADISMCGATELIGGGIAPQCLFDEKIVIDGRGALQYFLERKYIRAGMPTKLIKRDILIKEPFREDCKHEDIHTIYRYLAKASKVALWGIDKYCFVRHGENLSFFTSDQSQWTEVRMKEYQEAFAMRTQWVSENQPDLFMLAQYSEWSYMISMVDKIEQYKIEGCRGIEQEFINVIHKVKEEFLGMLWIKDFEVEWVYTYIG